MHIIILVFLLSLSLGHWARSEMSAPAEASVPLDFRAHQFSDDFMAWELDRRLDLIDVLVSDPYLSMSRYLWNTGEVDEHSALRLMQYVRDVQVNVYAKNALYDLNVPYLAFGHLWHPEARGMYDYKRSLIVIEKSVILRDMTFDDVVGLILHETAHHIYAHLGQRSIDLYNESDHYDDFTHDAHVLWFSTPNGGHVAADFEYWSNPQEKLAWDAQKMAYFVGLNNRRSLTMGDISQRFKDLEHLKQRWLSAL